MCGWALPTVGWLMFWSAYARSKPLLWAVLVPLFVLIANSWLGMLGAPSIDRAFLVNDVLGRLLFGIFPGAWLSGEGLDLGRHFRNAGGDASEVLHLFDPARVYALLGTAKLWIGTVAGAALIAVSVWLRRTRIETSA